MKGTQILKLAFIGNACFWLAVFFQYWKQAQLISPFLLQIILILGAVAIAINMGAYAYFLVKKPRIGSVKNPWVQKKPAIKAIGILHLFNLATFLVQVVFLITRL